MEVNVILDLYPEKAQYLTGEPIRLTAEMKNADVSVSADCCRAVLTVTRSEQIMSVTEKYLSDEDFEAGQTDFFLPGIETDFGGFGADLSVFRGPECVGTSSTAFDVVSDAGRAIRYGFLSDFDTADDDIQDIKTMRKYHINMVQYYDWSYRHDRLVAPSDTYEDMMGRRVDKRTVKKKIDACRRFGMKSVGYGAVYAASKEFYEKHRDWGLFTADGRPLVFIDTFYLMNISRQCPWHNHILEQYRDAVLKMGFDGIHMDTYGFPKTALSGLDGRGTILHMEDEYPLLIEDAKKALSDTGRESRLIFNNVGNWPVKTVADAPQEAVYIEVWPPYERYIHIRQIILDAKAAMAAPKPVILAAYLEPFRKDSPGKAGNAALLLTAATASCGASNLLLGEDDAVLTQGYYADHSFLSEAQAIRMRRYYDFLVRYMEILFDHSLRDVTMTHIGWDNTEYRFAGKWSASGDPGSIWLTIRENRNLKMISMVNLCGCTDDFWNKGKEEPEVQLGVEFLIQLDGPVKSAFWASPDRNGGAPEEIPFEISDTDRGPAARVIVPEVRIWSLLCIRTGECGFHR